MRNRGIRRASVGTRCRDGRTEAARIPGATTRRVSPCSPTAAWPPPSGPASSSTSTRNCPNAPPAAATGIGHTRWRAHAPHCSTGPPRAVTPPGRQHAPAAGRGEPRGPVAFTLARGRHRHAAPRVCPALQQHRRPYRAASSRTEASRAPSTSSRPTPSSAAASPGVRGHQRRCRARPYRVRVASRRPSRRSVPAPRPPALPPPSPRRHRRPARPPTPAPAPPASAPGRTRASPGSGRSPRPRPGPCTAPPPPRPAARPRRRARPRRGSGPTRRRCPRPRAGTRRLGRRDRQQACHVRVLQRLQLGRLAGQRQADVHQPHGTGVLPRRIDQQPRLARPERHRQVGADRVPAHLARVRVDPAGQVDRDDDGPEPPAASASGTAASRSPPLPPIPTMPSRTRSARSPPRRHLKPRPARPAPRPAAAPPARHRRACSARAAPPPRPRPAGPAARPRTGRRRRCRHCRPAAPPGCRSPSPGHPCQHLGAGGGQPRLRGPLHQRPLGQPGHQPPFAFLTVSTLYAVRMPSSLPPTPGTRTARRPPGPRPPGGRIGGQLSHEPATRRRPHR
ncbi:hypothetical protein STENM327S_04366 [Streptomyces tendae]